MFIYEYFIIQYLRDRSSVAILRCKFRAGASHVSEISGHGFGEHRRAVQANDVHQPVARHFNAGNHCISDMKIRALCPVSGSNDSRKKQEMSLISKLGTLQPLGINERFSYL